MPEAPHSPFCVILWRDVFVLIVESDAQPEHYRNAAAAVLTQSDKHPQGIGCITIIPPNASPPEETSRRAINAALQQMQDRVKCMCWLVEGDGFQGAMVRAILTGIRMFGGHTYPTHVSTNLQQAVAWVLPHLDGGVSRLAQVPVATATIVRERVHGGIREIA